MSPRAARGDERTDAATLLRHLAASCTQQPSGEHGWRRCDHCLAVHLVQQNDPLAMRLLQLALAAVERGS